MFALQAIVVALGLAISSYCAWYDILWAFGTQVPWYLAVLLGAVTNGVAITIAVILWVLHYVPAVHFPLFGVQ